MPVSVSTRSSLSERPAACEPRSTTTSELVSSVSSRASWTTGCNGSPCSTYQVMSRAASQTYSDAAPRRRRPRSASGSRASGAARRTQDSSSSCRMSDRASRVPTSAASERLLNSKRGIRESDRRLGEVLQLDEDVHRSVQLRERRRLLAGCLRQRRGTGQLTDVVHPFLGSADQEHVADGDHVFGAGIEAPVHPAPDRDHPHARFRREREIAERAAGCGSVVADLDPRRHLVGVTEILSERVGDPEPGGDDARDVGGGIAHALDRMRDPQDPGHPFGVLGATGGEHGGDAKAAEVFAHPLLEPFDLLRQLLLVEEDGRVGQVDHELGRVFQLDQEVLDVPRLFVHHGSTPDNLMTRRMAATPARSRSEVMNGTPWLSGSIPKRAVSTAMA